MGEKGGGRVGGMRRGGVTGRGAMSAVGNNAGEFWKSLAEGRSGIAPPEAPDLATLRFRNGAEVRGYKPTCHFDEKQADYLDRFAQFAVVSAREAIRDSGIEFDQASRESAGIVTGSCVGGQGTEDIGLIVLYQRGRPRVNPVTIPKIMVNAGASQNLIELGSAG